MYAYDYTYLIYYVFLECLEHLTTMIEDHGSSICHPSVEDACKKIAISIGDTSVRRPALDCLVALFFSHGDDILKFLGHVGHIT